MGRTKGSKNGISTTPGYIAIGEKAKGQLLTAGNNLQKHFAPAVNTMKKKLTTKEQNPAMPSTTAKYLDKQKAAKEKAMEPKIPQQPVQQQQAQQAQSYGDKMKQLSSLLKGMTEEQQANDYGSKMKKMSSDLKSATEDKQAQDYDKKNQDLKAGLQKLLGGSMSKGSAQKPKAGPASKEERMDPTKKEPTSNQNGTAQSNTTNSNNKKSNTGKSLLKQLKKLAESTVQSVEKGAVRNVGPSEIKKTAKSGLQSALDKIPDEKPKSNSENDNSLGEFVKADLKDRANSAKSKAIKKGKKYATETLNRMLDDERIQGDLRDMAETGYYKGEKEAVKQFANKMLDPKEAKKYSSVALDAAIPTYEKSKAKNEDRFAEFIKNDLQDRINDAKKKAKDKASDKVSQSVAKVTKDKRMSNEMRMLKEDPEAAVKKMVQDAKNDPKTAQKYKEVAADLIMPTYEGSKADLDDNFFDFMMNDIQDRNNAAKKKLKKKVTSW
jgi:hypothetical protein